MNLVDPDGRQAKPFSIAIEVFGYSYPDITIGSPVDLTMQLYGAFFYAGPMEADMGMDAYWHDEPEWGQVGSGGVSQQLDTWWPSLNETQGRVVLDAIAAAEAQMRKGGCNHFVTDLVSRLNQTSGLDLTLGDYEQVMASSAYYDGTRSQLVVSNHGTETTIANLFASNQNIIAHTDTPPGLPASVFLNSGFFTGNQGLRNSTVIHEGFHAMFGASDSGIARVLGWNGIGDASEWLTQRFMDNCGGN